MNLAKLMKKLGNDTVAEIDSLGADSLKSLIVQATQTIEATKEELDANDNYQRAKEDVNHLSQGYREVKARQTAKIKYALQRLTGIGG